MKLHIFNPEHDMALAYDKCDITLPHAIQEFKTNLSFMPALWADDGDCILTDDIPFAMKALKQTRRRHNDILFLGPSEIKNIRFDEICPWGWDKNIKSQLSVWGIDTSLLPADGTLQDIKSLSHRKQTTDLLKLLRKDIEGNTCGESFFADNIRDIQLIINRHKHVVVKAPWSSSGRGIRYIDAEGMDDSTFGWIQNTIKNQGGIMAEPYYNRLRDFAMEFYSHGNGMVDYRGLSVFYTEKSNYAGNLIATEEHKQNILGKYIPGNILSAVKERITDYFSGCLKGIYRGAFGIDMMIVKDCGGNGFLLHPCVEINLRMTMGHVANSLPQPAGAPEEFMRIVHDVNYKLKFETTGNNFVKVF